MRTQSMLGRGVALKHMTPTTQKEGINVAQKNIKLLLNVDMSKLRGCAIISGINTKTTAEK